MITASIMKELRWSGTWNKELLSNFAGWNFKKFKWNKVWDMNQIASNKNKKIKIKKLFPDGIFSNG